MPQYSCVAALWLLTISAVVWYVRHLANGTATGRGVAQSVDVSLKQPPKQTPPQVVQQLAQTQISVPPPIPAAFKPKTPVRTKQPIHPEIPESLRKINAAIALGDLLYNRGEYDDAIAEYRKGLDAAPNNAILRARIDRADKAKLAEQRVNH